MSPPTVSSSAAHAHGADADLARSAGAAQRAAHRSDPYIAAAGDQAAIAADAVRRQFTGAGVDLERSFDSAGVYRAIGSGDHHVIQARGLHGDRGDHRTAGRGEHDPLALRRHPHVVALHDAARFRLGTRADAQMDRVSYASAGARLHADRPVGIDPQAATRRRAAGEIAHEAVSLAYQAAWLRQGRHGQQQRESRMS